METRPDVPDDIPTVEQIGQPSGGGPLQPRGGGGGRRLNVGSGLGQTAIVSLIVSIIVVFAMGMFGGGSFVTKSDFTKNLNNITASLTQVTTDMAAKQNQVTTALNNIPTTVNNAVTQSTSQMSSQISSMSSKVDSANQAAQSAKNQLDTLSSQISSLTTKLNDATTKNNTMSDTITALEKRIKALEDKATAVAAAPTITGFTPTTGTSGTSVVITGTAFTGASAVAFGGTAASSFTVNSATQITAIVGGGNTGTVSVTTSGGTATYGTFTYTGTVVPPTSGVVASFSPTTTFGLPNDVNISITNNSGKEIFGGQIAISIQYIDGNAPSSPSNLVSLVSGSGVTWPATGSVSGRTVTIIGNASGVFVLNGQTVIVTITMEPGTTTTNTIFRVTGVTYSGWLQ